MPCVAVAVLPKQIGKHQANVFSFRGKPMHQVNQGMAQSVKAGRYREFPLA